MITDEFHKILGKFNDEGNTTRLFYMVARAFDSPINEQAVIDWCYKVIAKSKYVIKNIPTNENFKLITVRTKKDIVRAGYIRVHTKGNKTYIEVVK